MCVFVCLSSVCINTKCVWDYSKHIYVCLLSTCFQSIVIIELCIYLSLYKHSFESIQLDRWHNSWKMLLYSANKPTALQVDT